MKNLKTQGNYFSIELENGEFLHGPKNVFEFRQDKDDATKLSIYFRGKLVVVGQATAHSWDTFTLDGEEFVDVASFKTFVFENTGFNGGGTAPYKVYSALLNQSGTDNPVPSVLQNKIGPITFDYDEIESPGSYKILSDGLFTGNVVILPMFNDNNEIINFQVNSDSEIFVATSGDGLITNKFLEIRIYKLI